MINWITKMNEMFAENSYTNDKRVTVDYCENAESLLITVCGDTSVIQNIERFTEYGLMMECIRVADTLYNKK